jgi:hypothetical protein
MAIQVLNSQTMPAKPLSMFISGASRTSKTCSAATFPKPIFLSAGNENGDTSLRGYNVDIIRIMSVQDMRDAVNFVANNHVKYGWRTVVADSLTYYQDLYIAEVSKGGDKPLQIRDWGLLDLHMQKWLLPKLTSIGLHTVWISNSAEVKNADGAVICYQPMLYGQSKVKFPGACDLIVQTGIKAVRNPQTQRLETEYFYKTISTDGTPCGGRFGPCFAEGIIPANFTAIASRIGPYIGEEVPKI